MTSMQRFGLSTKTHVRAAVCATLFTCLTIGFTPSASFADQADSISDARVAEAISTIDGMAQKGVDNKTVVGLAIAVVHKDKVVFAKGYGQRDLNNPDQKIDADTVFQLASVSKPVSATVLAGLIGDNKITWDSKIADLDPSFAMSQPWVSSEITLRDFFCHRSGWPDHAGDLLEDIGYDRTQVLHRMRYQKPATSFRSRYAYTNFGITEAAVAGAKEYGLSWEDASEQKLYKPLQMNSTSSRFSDFINRPNRALGHVKSAGKWTQTYRRQPDAQSPAGGTSSSVNDMSKWLRLQLGNGKFEGKQVIAEGPLVETHKPQMCTGASPLSGMPTFYGLGMNVNYDLHGRLHLSHSGAFAMGAATNVNMVPKEQIGIVVLTNSYPIGFAEGLSETFMDISLYGKPSRDWVALYGKIFAEPETLGLQKSIDYSKVPSQKTAALNNSAYTAIYNNEFFGDASIIEKDGGLALVLGPHSLTLPMKHFDRDIFTYETVGENASGTSAIEFIMNATGKADGLTIKNFDEDGPHIFTRKK